MSMHMPYKDCESQCCRAQNRQSASHTLVSGREHTLYGELEQGHVGYCLGIALSGF
jgi:hypothetical protein